MDISQSSWEDVETYLQSNDCAVVPFGCTEQHGALSLATDTLLAHRVALEAAAPLGIPVFPPLTYGITPNLTAYPGTISLRFETAIALLRDILDGLYHQGFRRIVIVNGHGGNIPMEGFCREWLADHPKARLRFHNWWLAAPVLDYIQSLDPDASHASWMENFHFTRLPHRPVPTGHKPPVDPEHTKDRPPQAVRDLLGDGVFGGDYQRSQAEEDHLWSLGVETTRAKITDDW
ncbi:creatininase family protein [Halocynthiibacter namhaensis]|uniref:creatininase family protein n=1 Tax=Halocynthiibacter namhaensis TaxID=1290553 RepID=UPI0005792FCF|nr:creatininase family protein [Halocynthiibacter namhaensis]